MAALAAATARLSLPQFVPLSIRKTRTPTYSRAHSQYARAPSEPPKKLPFPMPTSPSPSSLPAAAPPPPPWPRAVSLDVEFSHYQKQPGGACDAENDDGLVLRVPADVAVVSDEGRVLLRALVSPPPAVSAATAATFAAARAYRWVGGVPREEAESAQGLALDLVARELARILSGGCLLVGHGVRGDLRALGGAVVAAASGPPSPSAPPRPAAPASPPLSVAASRFRDTSTSPGLLKVQRHRKSSSRKLDELFLGAFGLELRGGAAAARRSGPSGPPSPSPSSPSPPASSSASSSSASPPPPGGGGGVRHDPVADAAASMALYVTFVKGTLDDAASAAELELMESERVLQEFRARGNSL